MRKKQTNSGRPLIDNNQFEGYAVDLADLVAKQAEFEYRIHLVRDGKFGALVNHSWNGMIGELTRQVRVFIYSVIYVKYAVSP